MIWSPSLISDLTHLWGQKLSASQIAAELSTPERKITKNAVLGKRDRLGLPKRREGSAGRRGDRRPHEYRPPSVEPSKPTLLALAEPIPSPTLEEPVSALIQLFPDPPPVTAGVLLRDLAKGFVECRWIEGEPNGPDTLFCGACNVSGESYCATHLQRVSGGIPLNRKPIAQRRAA